MCRMLYVGSKAAPAPNPFRPDLTGICITPVNESDSDHGICAHFSAPFICQVGSQEGCSCRLTTSPGVEEFDLTDESEDEKVERELKEKAVCELRALILELVRHGDVELYVRWDGDQSMPPTSVAVVDHTSIPDPFRPSEGVFVTIT